MSRSESYYYIWGSVWGWDQGLGVIYVLREHLYLLERMILDYIVSIWPMQK